VNQRDDRLFVRRAGLAWHFAGIVAVPVLRVPTDPRFIDLDRATEQPGDWLHLHPLADAVQHVPRGFVRHFVLAANLPRANGVLRRVDLNITSSQVRMLILVP
jgi:hypothetical protein